MNLRRLLQWGNLLLSAGLMLAVWVLLVWVGSRPALKTLVDLSPQQRGTIDPVTIELLEGLEKQGIQVEFHTFFGFTNAPGQDVEQQQRQAILRRLRDLTTMLLRQYEFHGGDTVRVFHHDLYGDIAGTRAAIERFGGVDHDSVVVAVEQPGMKPRHRQLSVEGDLGVVQLPELQRNTQVAQARIPVLKDYKGEEALSSALKGLLVQGVPTIYFLRGNSLNLDLYGTTGGGYAALLNALDQQGFKCAELDLSRTPVVPRDASMVAVLEPRREFASTEVGALHDYVKGGGRLFLNYNWSPIDGWNPDGGELGKLFGFEVGPRRLMHMIRAGHDGRGVAGDPRVTKLDLLVNENHPITRRIFLGRQLLQLDDARELRRRSDAPQGVRFDAPLLTTGPQAWLEQPTSNDAYDYSPPRAPNPFRQYPVGGVIEVDAADGKTGYVVVVTGLFGNNLGLPINGTLAGNIANWLTERRVLLDIKGQRYEARHIQLVTQQFEAIWFLLVAFVPLALLLTGAVVFWRRRRHGPRPAVAAAAAGAAE